MKWLNFYSKQVNKKKIINQKSKLVGEVLSSKKSQDILNLAINLGKEMIKIF